MPRPKRKSTESTEKERFEILLEEIHSEIKQLAEGQGQFREEVQRSFQELRAEMAGRFIPVEQALQEVSQRLRTHEETHAG